MTTIDLTEIQARAFLLLSKANAWDIKSGSVEIRFDEFGQPVSVKATMFTRLE